MIIIIIISSSSSSSISTMFNPLAVEVFCYPPIGMEIKKLHTLTLHGFFFIVAVCHELFLVLLEFRRLWFVVPPLSEVQNNLSGVPENLTSIHMY